MLCLDPAAPHLPSFQVLLALEVSLEPPGHSQEVRAGSALQSLALLGPIEAPVAGLQHQRLLETQG